MPQSKESHREWMKRRRDVAKGAQEGAQRVHPGQESVHPDVHPVKSPTVDKEARILELRSLLGQAYNDYGVEQLKARGGLQPGYASINYRREPWFEELHRLEEDRPGHYFIPARFYDNTVHQKK